jgi:hypothetical protein
VNENLCRDHGGYWTIKRGDSGLNPDNTTRMYLILPSSVVYKREASPFSKIDRVLALFRQNILPASRHYRRSSIFIGSKISSAIHHAGALALLRPRPFLARLTFSATHAQSNPGSCDKPRLNLSRVSPCDFFLLITV